MSWGICFIFHFKHFFHQEAEYSLSQQFPLNDDRLRYSVEPSSAQVNCATVLKPLFRLWQRVIFFVFGSIWSFHLWQHVIFFVFGNMSSFWSLAICDLFSSLATCDLFRPWQHVMRSSQRKYRKVQRWALFRWKAGGPSESLSSNPQLCGQPLKPPRLQLPRRPLCPPRLRYRRLHHCQSLQPCLPPPSVWLDWGTSHKAAGNYRYMLSRKNVHRKQETINMCF